MAFGELLRSTLSLADVVYLFLLNSLTRLADLNRRWNLGKFKVIGSDLPVFRRAEKYRTSIAFLVKVFPVRQKNPSTDMEKTPPVAAHLCTVCTRNGLTLIWRSPEEWTDVDLEVS